MEEQRTTSFFRFEDLRIYDKSLEYYNWLTTQVKQADDFAKKALFMPLLDSAAKISINIAEGTSYHKIQFINFLKNAKSNVRECVVFTTMAQQNGFFDASQAETSRTILIEMTKMLGAMIVSLQKRYARKQNDEISGITTEQEEVASQPNNVDFDMDFNY